MTFFECTGWGFDSTLHVEIQQWSALITVLSLELDTYLIDNYSANMHLTGVCGPKYAFRTSWHFYIRPASTPVWGITCVNRSTLQKVPFDCGGWVFLELFKKKELSNLKKITVIDHFHYSAISRTELLHGMLSICLTHIFVVLLWACNPILLITSSPFPDQPLHSICDYYNWVRPIIFKIDLEGFNRHPYGHEI